MSQKSTELHVPYSWCPKDECECYWPECREHGCMAAKKDETDDE